MLLTKQHPDEEIHWQWIQWQKQTQNDTFTDSLNESADQWQSEPAYIDIVSIDVVMWQAFQLDTRLIVWQHSNYQLPQTI